MCSSDLVFGTLAAIAGVAMSAAVPRLATGPLIVLVAAVIFVVSCLVAPRRGWLARGLRQRQVRRTWAEARLLASGGAAAARLSAGGRERAADHRRRVLLWNELLAIAPEDARAALTIDVPDPEAVLDPAVVAAARAAVTRRGA